MLALPCCLVLLLLSTVTLGQMEKRFSNDYMGLLHKYQYQKRFNNDYIGMLGRYQQRPYKRMMYGDYYNWLRNYQDRFE